MAAANRRQSKDDKYLTLDYEADSKPAVDSAQRRLEVLPETSDRRVGKSGRMQTKLAPKKWWVSL
jgi:hypothetical protein